MSLMNDWNRRGVLAMGGSAVAATAVRAEAPPPAALAAALDRVRDMMAPAKTPTPDDAPEVTAQALALFARGPTPLAADRFAPEISALIGPQAAEVMPPISGPT